MRITASFAALLISVLVGLAIAEGALRLLGIGYGNAPFEGDRILHHVHPRSFTYLSYDPNGEYGGHVVHYDAQGRRAPPEGGPAPRPRTVVVLGDSNPEALQLAYEDTYIGLLNAMQSDVVFLNYGVSRYSPVISELQLRQLLPEIRPAVVLQVLHRNDPGEDREYLKDAVIGPDGIPQAVPGADQHSLSGMLRSLYVARLVRRAQIQLQFMLSDKGVVAGRIVEDNDPVGPETHAALERTRALARRDGVAYVLTCVPSQIRSNRVAPDLVDRFCPSVAEYARSVNVPYVDLNAAFARASEPPFFSVDIHFNRLGHRLAAGAIFDALRPLGLSADRSPAQ